MNDEFDGSSALSEALSEKIGRNIEIKNNVRGFRAKWVELAHSLLSLLDDSTEGKKADLQLTLNTDARVGREHQVL